MLSQSFDNVHRKVEYGYSETFGDDEGSSVHHDDMDDFSSFFDEGNYGGFDGDNFFVSPTTHIKIMSGI